MHTQSVERDLKSQANTVLFLRMPVFKLAVKFDLTSTVTVKLAFSLRSLSPQHGRATCQ